MHKQADNHDLFRWGVISLTIGVVCLWLVLGCSKRERTYTTGLQLARSELPFHGFTGDDTYSVVLSSALPEFYADFQNVLFSQGGLSKWNARYDCNHFAALYVALAQARYAVAAFQSDSAPQTLALGEFWYRPSATTTHAIVIAVTELGVTFIEPQTGEVITLTDAQKASCLLCKF